jgi:hypothetical protein
MLALLTKRFDRKVDVGVVDQYVHLAHVLLNLGYHAINLRTVPDVSLHREGPASRRSYLIHDLFSGFPVPEIVDTHSCPVGG